MENKGRIKVVVFDMNGVIIDDEYIHEMAFRKLLDDYGVDLTHELYLAYFAGRTDKDGLVAIAKATGTELPLEKLLKEKTEGYFKAFPVFKKSYPGVLDLIKFLEERYTLALVSSASRKEVDLVLKEFDITRYFSATVSADDVSRGKPDPEPYLKAAKLLNVEPAECAIIEDSKSGIESAKSAGMCSIGVTTTRDENDLAAAEVVVNNFSQITPELIQRAENLLDRSPAIG